MQALPMLRPGLSVPHILDAQRVAEEAEGVISALPIARGEQFESLYSYLIVDEPSVHLLPLHFLPSQSEERVGSATLHALGVAAKLEYAPNRWLDEMVDAKHSSALPLAAHRLNDALVSLINHRYRQVLSPAKLASFHTTLVELYARHGLSLVLDSWRAGYPECAMSLKEYVAHAKARHGPMRAPLDALLLLADVPERTIRKARASWHRWELGVQFYDDALDIEEDYSECNTSWVVSRTIEIFRSQQDSGDSSRLPDPNEFYKIALTEGVVCEALSYAERFFAAAASQAEQIFPTWAEFQRQCLSRTIILREDYEKMIAEAEET